jgi:16S rRNA (guanine527-N7)-methyltransferase
VPRSTQAAADDAIAHALAAGVRELGASLPDRAQDRLLAYIELLVKWNAAYNLTGVRDPREMVTRHLLDSLSLLPLLTRGTRLLDAGAGAGLPGIPLALALPHWHVTLLDSNGKKARFLRHAARTLALDNVDVAEARVESYDAAPYDAIVSRAFSALDEFFDKTAHLLAPGGQWVAMKGKLDARELAAVPARYHIIDRRRLRVPGLDEERHAIVAVAESRVPSPESRSS